MFLQFLAFFEGVAYVFEARGWGWTGWEVLLGVRFGCFFVDGRVRVKGVDKSRSEVFAWVLWCKYSQATRATPSTPEGNICNRNAPEKIT